MGFFKSFVGAYKTGQDLADLPHALFKDAMTAYGRSRSVDRVEDPLDFAEFVRDFRYGKFTEYIEHLQNAGHGLVVGEMQQVREQVWREDKERVEKERKRAEDLELRRRANEGKGDP